MRRLRTNLVSDLRGGFVLVAVTLVSTSLNVNLWSVPRFDGAGYAVLGEALATGRGYREINKPDAPPHDHFPPGYPLTLAALWQLTGRSLVAAHLLSEACTVVAVALAWKWFQTIYPPKTAYVLGLALAVNWTWGRAGGSIQSEPVYLFWELLIVLLASKAERHNTVPIGIALGVALAGSILTRHVGLCLAVAVGLTLGLCRHWRALLTASSIASVLILPWINWLRAVRHHSQFSLFTWDNLGVQIARQSLFYLQRLPDQIAGPFVEVATVMHRSWPFGSIANLWAIVTSTIMVWGWVQTIRTRRRRLAGLIANTTLVLLVVWPFTEAGRFLIPLVPMLLIGLTEGIAHLIRLCGANRPRQWAVVIVFGMSFPYSAYSILNGRAEAQRDHYVDFDAACVWITKNATTAGPVLTQHPGEVFWQTGHLTIEPDSPVPDAIERLINQLGVAYLLVDHERYVNAEVNPLAGYVREYPDRAVLVWEQHRGNMSVQIFKIVKTD